VVYSFKVIENGDNQKPACDFLVVFHWNYMPTYYNFRHISIWWLKSPFSPTPVTFKVLARGVTLGRRVWKLVSKNYSSEATRWCKLYGSMLMSPCLLKLQFAKLGTFFWDTLYTVLRECKIPPRHLISTKVIPDLNPDFQINQDSDQDVCRIAPKCCGFIILLAPVTLPSVVKIGRWLYEKC